MDATFRIILDDQAAQQPAAAPPQGQQGWSPSMPSGMTLPSAMGFFPQGWNFPRPSEMLPTYQGLFPSETERALPETHPRKIARQQLEQERLLEQAAEEARRLQ